MKNLSNEEMKNINGGHDGTAYKIGKFIGDAIEVGLTVFGIGKVAKGAKAAKKAL